MSSTNLSDELRKAGFAPAPQKKRIPVSRASFLLSDRNAFDSAVQLAAVWMGATARSNLPDDAARGLSFEFSSNNEQAQVSALRMDDEQGRIWAGRVSYLGDQTAERDWLTDLFVEQRHGSFVRFGAQLACESLSDDPGFIHSRPRVIKEILAELAGEADGEALGNEVQSVSLDDVNTLAGLLYNSARRLPIVLVSIDDNGGSQIDLGRLANRLSGTAHLRSLATEEGFELSRLVGRRMSTFNGAVRIYMPGLEEGTEDPFQHPLWLAPRSGFNPKLIDQLASRILPLGFRDPDGDARFWRVGLIRQATSRAAADTSIGSREEKLEAEVEALRSERDAFRETAETAEGLMNDEALKLNIAQSDVARLEEENFSLRERIKSTISGTSVSSISLAPSDIHDVFEQSPNLETSLRVIANVFSDRVVILESAYDSAQDSYAFLHRKKAFALLWSLCTEYWSALNEGQGDVTARQCFGASYAAKEAEKISTAGRKRRTFEYKGIEIEMEKHLKIGVADNKTETLRIHFEWVADQRVIVIGHCGGHLDF